jgi:hypothetical protein
MYSYDKNLCNSWISFDRGETKHSGFFDYNFSSLHPLAWDKFLDVWEQVKKKRQSDMRRTRQDELKTKLKEEALKLGVDPQEYIKQKLLEQREENQRKKEVTKAKRSIEEMEKLMKLSTTLRSFEAQIETLRQKITDENSVIKLGYYNKNMEKLDVALCALQYMNGNPKK